MNQNLTLASIRIDGGTQSREALDQDKVAEYADIVRDGTDMDPAVVFFDGGINWLADGFHRYFGYQKADRASMPCDVRAGTLRDAVVHSWGANGRHGLPRNNADKRRAVMAALADPEYSIKSLREIAAVCAVSQEFVRLVKTPKPVPPKAEPKPPTTGGPSAPAGHGVSTVDSPLPPTEKTEAEIQAEIAHGDDDTLELLQSTQRELEEAHALLQAAEADDLKAEAIRWRRMYETAQRRQQEMQARVNEREAELLRLTNWLRRIAKAVDESDPSKVAAVVEALARRVKVVA